MKIKTISTIILAASVAFACKPEKEIVPASPVQAGEQITITASSEGNPTKTVLQSDGTSIWWQADDSINLFYGPSVGGAKFDNTATEASEVTTFTGTLNSVIGASEGATAADKKFWGVYPYDAATEVTADGEIKMALQLGKQMTQAGTFAPAAFPSVACADGLTLKFYNVCGALAIDVEEEGVQSIILKGNNGEILNGDAVITLADGKPAVAPLTAGEEVIALYPDGAASFEKGKTYYMAVLPTTFSKGVTITLQKSAGAPVVLSTDKELKVERNKTNAVVAKEKVLTLKKVWVHNGVAGVAGWPAYVSGMEDFDTFTRSATMDDEYVYIPKFSTAATDGIFDEATIGMLKVSDGTFAGKVQRTIDPDYMANATWAQTVPISCARIMKNTDASINNGKDILIASNLCDGQNVRVYAWINGVTQEPKMIANFSNGRRMGDRIAVTGTYQEGRIWFRQSLSQSMNAWLTVTNGTTPSYGFDALGAATFDDAESMSEYTAFNNGEFALVPTNTSVGLHLVEGTTQVKLYPSLKRCFGWTPFEFNGKQYLAFLDMATVGTNLPIITVLEGASDTVENLQATLDSFNVVAKASLASADQNDFATTSAYATNNQGDCTVRIIDGTPYIMGMARGGVGVFKLVLE